MIMVTSPECYSFIKSNRVPRDMLEKPRHLKYLNEFRTSQCPLFLEQQCHNHRPYTCFYWHFPNQKRRRPLKRVDGTFNYNPDVYCDKYDENAGTCPEADECPYAHRNAGDTERRYHPRYFKTGNCIYETTENGACVKNGLHCAFAHGPDDLRLPVYDIREVPDANSSKVIVNLPASLEKERVLSEDPTWNDMLHVMARYKTESCRKPPRMCRQGYSCPYFHNGKDKRRMPDRYFYRSTPCPTVRPGDEWLDSSMCEAGDGCSYCHTRTEQQFHPEIYKSTKCNDVLSSGYCPRGPFCAFAHADNEMTLGRNYLQAAAAAVAVTTHQLVASPRQQEVSPVSSSSSSGLFSPSIRPLQGGGGGCTAAAARGSPGSHLCPGGMKLKGRHRSGGAGSSGASTVDSGIVFDQPSAVGQQDTHMALFAGPTGFVRGGQSQLPPTRSLSFLAAEQQSGPQGTGHRQKMPMTTNKLGRPRLESCGPSLESYTRSLSAAVAAVQQQQQQQQQQNVIGAGPVRGGQPKPSYPAHPSSHTAHSPTSPIQGIAGYRGPFQQQQPQQGGGVAWWIPPDAAAPTTTTTTTTLSGQSKTCDRHHPDNEYLNSLITEDLRTALTVNTSSEDFQHHHHHHNQHQFFKMTGLQGLAQSPLSSLLRQMSLSTNTSTAAAAKRGSGLFDPDDPMGGVVASPLCSPQETSVTTTATSMASSEHNLAVSVASAGYQTAPVCIPTNGNRSQHFPCGCNCCRGMAGGHDSAFNSGGTPTVVCELGGLVGAAGTSAHSRTSEGQDSALALSEVAKDDDAQLGTPSDPPSGAFGSGGGSYGSMLMGSLPSSFYRPQSLIPTPTTTTTTPGQEASSPTQPSKTRASSFTGSVTQSPVLPTSPFSNPAAEVEKLSLKRELEETKERMNLILQENDVLRRDNAEKCQQTAALVLLIRQIVILLSNFAAESMVGRQSPPQQDSTAFLNELLHALLSDQVVRTLFPMPKEGAPSTQQPPPLESAVTQTSTSGKRIGPTSRKSSSNLSSIWSAGSVLEDLEEEDQAGVPSLEAGDSAADDLRRALFSGSTYSSRYSAASSHPQHSISGDLHGGVIGGGGGSHAVSPPHLP